jgi:diaminohydroxyphosphoribosylaminopyrimidine deaminase/5-amino-6-(5-phosphoribosylamino)uracil reductase
MKIAASLDGVTALESGQSQWITLEAARLDGHHWRARACAILTGIGTLKNDNPQLTVRGVDTPRQPLRVLVDSKLEVSLDAKILEGGNTLVVCATPDEAHFEKMHQELRARAVSLLKLPNPFGKVDLPGLLKFLAEHHQVNELHIEAGYQLNGSLIKEGCVDELLLYLAPCFLGSGMGLARIGPLHDLNERVNLEPIDQELLGSDLRLRYKLLPKETPSK